MRTVAIEALGAVGREGGRFRVLIDGVPHEVDSRVTELGLSLRYEDGRTVDAAVTEQGRGELWVQLARVAVEASVDARRYRRAGSGPVAQHGQVRISAPMPGRVVRVLVAAGDTVSAGQGLVVVEAMKMENEISAPRAGRVGEVSVAPGQSVESGRLLLTIE
jgi:biotin carboxyl carrier protein